MRRPTAPAERGRAGALGGEQGCPAPGLGAQEERASLYTNDSFVVLHF